MSESVLRVVGGDKHELLSLLWLFARGTSADRRGGVVGPHLVGGSGGPPSRGGDHSWVCTPPFPPRRETAAPGGFAPMPPTKPQNNGLPLPPYPHKQTVIGPGG